MRLDLDVVGDKAAPLFRGQPTRNTKRHSMVRVIRVQQRQNRARIPQHCPAHGLVVQDRVLVSRPGLRTAAARRASETKDRMLLVENRYLGRIRLRWSPSERSLRDQTPTAAANTGNLTASNPPPYGRDRHAEDPSRLTDCQQLLILRHLKSVIKIMSPYQLCHFSLIRESATCHRRGAGSFAGRNFRLPREARPPFACAYAPAFAYERPVLRSLGEGESEFQPICRGRRSSRRVP